jgi:hypothetical protein
VTAARRPVRRRAVALAVLVAVAVVAGVVELLEAQTTPGPARRDPADVASPSPEPTPGAVQPEGGCPVSPEGGGPADVLSSRLVDCPDGWDGRMVRIRGEVVGPRLARGGEVWLQVDDDVHAGTGRAAARPHLRGNGGIGVALPADLARAVSAVGGPGRRGDLVEVVGRFRRVDPDTGEVAVLRASDLEVQRRGGPVGRPTPAGRVPAAVAALLGAAVAVVLRRRAAQP